MLASTPPTYINKPATAQSLSLMEAPTQTPINVSNSRIAAPAMHRIERGC